MLREAISRAGHTAEAAELQARARALGIVIACVGAVVFFVGWGLGFDRLKSLGPDMASMKANTAMCFALLGAALWRAAHRRRADPASLALAGAVALTAVLTLIEYIAGLDFGIDQLFFLDPATDPSAFPGRMAMATATGFLLGSSALLLLDTPLRKVTSGCAIALVLLGLAALTGYLYDVEAFYSLFPFSSMALHTATCFFLLGTGILLSRPDRDLLRPATGGRSGALLVRRLLPWTVVVPLFTGWLEILGQNAGLYPPHFGLALFTVVNIVILAMLVAAAANRLNDAEQQLERSETRFRALFADNPQAMWVCDRETLAFLEVNDAAVELYGYSRDQFLERTLHDFLLRETAHDSNRAPADLVEGLHEHRYQDGKRIDVELISNAILHRSRPAFLVLATNVSEKKRLERLLVQSQKMEAVGQLAGGIAHDFNNLLGVVKGYSDLLGRNRALDERGQFHVRQIGKITGRAASLTRQLLTFGRKQMLQPKLFALDETVSDMVEMLRRILGEDIRLVARLSPDTGHVRADSGQIEQVVMNLALNARDAMPSGGELVLETRAVTIDETNRAEHPELPPGRYNLLIASDSGSGMDPVTLDRIFDPFFTTKRPGKGTGLGLSTVYGIVQQSGGHIEVRSESGRGTTFEIYLPLVEPAKDAKLTDHDPSEHVEDGSRAEAENRTILLIEDTDDLRKILREILEEEGYQVVEAGSPSEASALAAHHNGRLDLVIADVVMPGGTGPKTVEQLRESRPNLRAIYMSGYLGEALGELEGIDPELEFLQKPFHTDSLLGKVRKALELAHDDLATEALED